MQSYTFLLHMPSQQVQVGHHQVQAEAAPCLTESCRVSVAPLFVSSVILAHTTSAVNILFVDLFLL